MPAKPVFSILVNRTPSRTCSRIAQRLHARRVSTRSESRQNSGLVRRRLPDVKLLHLQEPEIPAELRNSGLGSPSGAENCSRLYQPADSLHDDFLDNSKEIRTIESQLRPFTTARRKTIPARISNGNAKSSNNPVTNGNPSGGWRSLAAPPTTAARPTSPRITRTPRYTYWYTVYVRKNRTPCSPPRSRISRNWLSRF